MADAAKTPIRVMMAKIGLDGHDRGVKVVGVTAPNERLPELRVVMYPITAEDHLREDRRVRRAEVPQ